MPLGENVRRWRTRRAMSQDDLATAAGVTQATVWRVERGDKPTRPSTLRKLADALKVDPAKLLGDEDEKVEAGNAT